MSFDASNDTPGFAVSDPQMEAILRDRGVSYRLVRMPIKDLGLNFRRLTEMANPYRVQTKLDQEAIDQYVLAMAQGDRFPPVVVGDLDGVLKLLGGWHRCGAAIQAGFTDCLAYRCEVDGRLATALGIATNLRVSQVRVTEEERFALAVKLVLEDHWTNQDAIRECLVSKKAFETRLYAQRARNRVTGSGVSAPEILKLKPTSLQALERLKDNHEFLAAGRAMAVRGGGTDDHKALVTALLGEGDSERRVEIIDTWQPAAPTNGKPGRSKDEESGGGKQSALHYLRRALSMLANMNEGEILAEARNDAQMQSLIRTMTSMGHRLLAVSGLLEDINATQTESLGSAAA